MASCLFSPTGSYEHVVIFLNAFKLEITQFTYFFIYFLSVREFKKMGREEAILA